MAFTLHSNIVIGKFAFKGVHEVRIKKSLRSYIDTAVVKIPAKCRVLKKDGKSYGDVETGKQFSEGDQVVINLGYNDDIREEFRGFVKRVNFNIPCEVECEGYSYQLRRNTVKGSWKTVTLKELVNVAIAGTDVKAKVVYDMNLINVAIPRDVIYTGADVLDFIEKETHGAVTAYFEDAQTLWVGLKYSAKHRFEFKENNPKYVLGKNVVRDGQLKERLADKMNFIVNFLHKDIKGKKHKGEAVRDNAQDLGKIKKFILQHVSDPAKLKELAEAYADDELFNGYEGKINAFLQPYAEPGDKATLVDRRYSIKGGDYVIEETEVIFGRSGGRRIVDIRTKVG